MAKDVTISSELGGVLSTGAFENLKPYFNFSVTYKNVESFPENEFEKDLDKAEKAQKKAYERLYKQLEYCEEQARQKAIEKFHKNIRWYDIGNGIKYPSVTSVIDFANPINWFVDENRKRGLAARGQVMDIVLQKFIEDGVWTVPEEIPECIRYLQIMKDTDVTIEGNLSAFVDKYDIKFKGGHEVIINHKYKYGGELDCTCAIGDDSALILPDLKSFNPDSKGQIRTLKQTAAYAMGREIKPQKIGIFPIHGGNKQGYSKPVISDNIDKYFEMFLEDRKVFTDTFGI